MKRILLTLIVVVAAAACTSRLDYLKSSPAFTHLAIETGRIALTPAGCMVSPEKVSSKQLKALREDAAFPPSQAATEPLKVILRKAIDATIRDELELRGDAIHAELATQEALLGVLADTIGHDVALGITIAERLLVIDPLVAESPVGSPEGWVATRQRLRVAEQTVAEVRAARAAAKALRQAFEAILGAQTEAP